MASLAASGAAVADTTHVREFAKNETPVRIVALGEQSREVAEELRGQIARHPDWKKGKRADSVRVLGIDEIESASREPGFLESTLVFMVATKERERIPAAVAGLIPVRL